MIHLQFCYNFMSTFSDATQSAEVSLLPFEVSRLYARCLANLNARKRKATQYVVSRRQRSQCKPVHLWQYALPGTFATAKESKGWDKIKVQFYNHIGLVFALFIFSYEQQNCIFWSFQEMSQSL